MPDRNSGCGWSELGVVARDASTQRERSAPAGREPPASGVGRLVSFRSCLVVSCAFCALACAPPVADAPASAPVAVPAAGKLLPAAIALTADEQQLSVNLRAHSETLVSFGERTPQHSWELADAADYLAAQFESLGYPVERQGYESEEALFQNLSVTITGSRQAKEVLVVGAHYDSPEGNPGLETAASAAALLEIARMMKGAILTRTLKLALFSLGEAPHGSDELRGARRFARQLASDAAAGPPPGVPEALRAGYGFQTVGLVHLGPLAQFLPPAGSAAWERVVYLTTTPGSNHLSRALEPALFGDPLRTEVQRSASPPEESDLLAFFEQGIPAVSVSGGHPVREQPVLNADFDTSARVVMRIRAGLGEILGEKPQNDQMLTPPGTTLR